jgi:hypothetical protein
MAILEISWLFAIFFPRFGMLYQEKSGNPVEVVLAWRQKTSVVDLNRGLVRVGYF